MLSLEMGKPFFWMFELLDFRIKLAIICALTICMSCGEGEKTTSTNKELAPLFESKTSTSRSPSAEAKLFSQINPQESGIAFSNVITETESLNILTYEYLYNGAGVAVGDINNDNLPDLFFAGNIQPDRLYLNEGNWKFKEISAAAAVLDKAWSTGVNMIDINADGFLDIYVCRSLLRNPVQRRNKMLINQRDGTFKDKAMEMGIADEGYSTQSYFFDVDEDGDLDLWVLNHRNDMDEANSLNISQQPDGTFKRKLREIESGVNRLYINNGNGKFTELNDKIYQHSGFSLSAAIFDQDQDGKLDYYLANDFIDPDHFIQCKKNSLQDQFGQSSRNSMGCDWADINNDGLYDLIVTDMLPSENYRQKVLKGPDPYDKFHGADKFSFHKQVMRNTLQVSNKNLPHADLSNLHGVANTDWSWSPLFVDVNNNGLQDLLISNGLLRDLSDMDFSKYDMPDYNRKKASSQTAMELHELVSNLPTHPTKNRAFKNTGGTFEEVGASWNFDIPKCGNGMAYGDLDNDGDMDIVINNLNSPASVLRNQASERLLGNYITIELLDEKGKNISGLGATVFLEQKGKKQMRDVLGTRGFFSCSQHIAHFGLPSNTKIDRLTIYWNSKEQQVLENVQPNQHLTIKKENTSKRTFAKKSKSIFFKQVQNQTNFAHKENAFIDFKRESLIPHFFSNRGPCIAEGDLNGDGKTDLFIGGARGQASQVLLQTANGGFSLLTAASLSADLQTEDMDAEIADFNGDGLNDIYVVSGGSSEEDSHASYADRLYFNKGNGQFEKLSGEIDERKISGSKAVHGDWDGDGDVDLIVGGRIVPGSYPIPAQTIYWENQNGKLKDRSELLPNAGKIGLVNDVVKAVNHPSADLLLAGEWMGITALKYEGGQFKNVSQSLGFDRSGGWWNCLELADLNGDGKMDIVAGNRGLNSFYKASENQPAQIHAGDYDDNGSIDAIISYYFEDGKSYPQATRDELFVQLPMVRKKFARYRDFGNAQISNILDAAQLKKTAVYQQVQHFESAIFLQNTDGSFSFSALPLEAQVAPIFATKVLDVNKDGTMDILAVGNNSGVDVETGVYDGIKGLLLLGNGKGEFEALSSYESGFNLSEEGRAIALLRLGNKQQVIVGCNNSNLKIFELK